MRTPTRFRSLPIFQPDPGWAAAALLGVSVKISKHLNTQCEVGGVWNGMLCLKSPANYQKQCRKEWLYDSVLFAKLGHLTWFGNWSIDWGLQALRVQHFCHQGLSSAWPRRFFFEKVHISIIYLIVLAVHSGHFGVWIPENGSRNRQPFWGHLEPCWGHVEAFAWKNMWPCGHVVQNFGT